jgi:starch-binding outer membrane protein, SusD/RagB family
MKLSISSKIACAILAIGIFGCEKRLKEYNPSGMTAEAAYTTPAGYETLVNAAYSYARHWYGKEEGFGLGEVGSDIWTAGSETIIATSGLSADNKPMVMYQAINSSNLNIQRVWKRLYAAVNLCNSGIKIGESGSDFTPSAVRVAELRFLRAFYNYHIVETWGGVHLTTEPTTEVVLTANRTPVDKFYELITSDLIQAVAGLPVKAEYGRLSKPAAEAFLAKVYLTRGNYTEANNLANSVINNYGYKLVDNYLDLWDVTKTKTNTENIWSVNYGVDPNSSDVYDADRNPFGYGVDILSANGNPTTNRGNNNSHLYFVCGYDRSFPEFGSQSILGRSVLYGAPFIRYKPTKYLMDLYDETKDSRYGGSFQTVWIMNKVISKPGDRLRGKVPFKDTACVITKNPAPKTNYYTFDVMSTYNAEGGSKNVSQNQLFPVLRKHLDPSRTGTLIAGTNPLPDGVVSNQSNQSAKDFYIIRFAEMYLIAAEASMRMGNTADAADKLNILREKRALAGKSADMRISAGDVTPEFILDERAREFAGEGSRWFDLKRIKSEAGAWVSWIETKNPDVKGSIQAFHRFRPIPQVQLDAVTNKGEFTQNSGY